MSSGISNQKTNRTQATVLISSGWQALSSLHISLHVCSPALLLLCVHVRSHFSRVLFFTTPQIIASQAPLFIDFSQQEYWSGLPGPPPGDLPNPGMELPSFALQADSLPQSHQALAQPKYGHSNFNFIYDFLLFPDKGASLQNCKLCSS